MTRARPTDDLVDALVTASRALVGIAAASVASVADEVTLPQYRALVVLQSRGPQPLRALADELQVVPSTATRMCDRLVRKGLITREPAPGSRRSLALAISPAGSAIVASVTRGRRRAIDRIVSTMPEEDRDGLVGALRAFAAAAGEDPDDPWFLGWT